MPAAVGYQQPPAAGRPSRRWIWITATIAACIAVALLVTAGVVTWSAVDRSRRQQFESFGPTGHGPLRLGMSKDAAVATGVPATTQTVARAECAEYTRRTGPQPDPTMLTATEESVKTFERATKAAEEADAAVGPSLTKGTTLPELQARVQRLKAVSDAEQAKRAAMLEMMRLGQERMVALQANGALTFNGRGELVRLFAPPGARTSEGIRVGSSDHDLQRAYGSDLSEEDGVYIMRASPRRADYIYQFSVENGNVEWIALSDRDDSCV